MSVQQLRDAGLGDGAIKHRAACGRLHSKHRGVYALSPAPLSQLGRLWAAVLACGGVEACALSHQTAGAHYGMCPWPRGVVHVTTLRRAASARGIVVHRSGTLTRADIVRLPDELPVTSPTRTLIDLSSVFDDENLARACRQAEFEHLLELEALLAHPSRALRRALEPLGEPAMTRSELEEAFLALIARHGLPRPLVNHPLLDGTYVADFLFPRHKLVVEVDGRRAHDNRFAFEHDRWRDSALAAEGFLVLRFTARQIRREASTVADRVRRALAHRAA